MKMNIETTLSELARIDNGALTITPDPNLYPDAVLHAFVGDHHPHYTAILEGASGESRLTLHAVDPNAARLQLGEALTRLLAHGIRHRQ